MRSTTRVIDSWWGMYSIGEPGGMPDPDDPSTLRQPHKLINLRSPHWLMVRTGTKEGPVRLTIEVHDQQPAEVSEEWEVVEVGLDVRTDELFVADWNGELIDSVAMSEGPWCLRICVKGFNEGAAYQWQPSNPVEEHLLQFWPRDRQARPMRDQAPSRGTRDASGNVYAD